MSIAIPERHDFEPPEDEGVLEIQRREVSRTEWELGIAAMHGSSTRDPILSSEDYRSQTGSWGPFTKEFGLPDSPRPLDQEAKTFKTQELVDKVQAKLQAQFTQGVEKAVRTGHIPQFAQRRLPGMFENAPTRVFATTPDVIEDAVKAFYDEYDNTFNIAGNLSHALIREKTPHEWTHQISGGTFIEQDDAFGGYRRIRVGFGEALPENEGDYSNRYLTDMLTEHATAGIMEGEFDVLDPDLRENDKRAYRNMRKMGAVYIDLMGVSSKTMVRALFEDDTGSDATRADRDEMMKQNIEAAGPDWMEHLNMLLGAVEDDTRFGTTSEKFRSLAECIVPPVRNEQGAVIRKGYINIERVKILQEAFKKP